MHDSPARARLPWICALAVAALAALAYRDAITHDFTGGDTVALIEVSRIQSFDDLVRMLTQPMLPIVTKFYRPTANFSYAVDSWIWGLDARGFHITDVALHALVSALIAFLTFRCTQSRLGALLAGATFALHPSLMETVPSSARRHDMVAGALMLLSLLSLPDLDTTRARFFRWTLSLLFCALALGAKEASIVFPGVVFTWALFVHLPSANGRLPWSAALKVAAPHAAIAVAFVAIRAVVLGGAGGNARSWSWTFASIPGMGRRAADFVADQAYPLRVLFHPYTSTTDRLIAVAAAIGCLFVLLSLGRRRRASPATTDGREPLKALVYGGAIACAAVLLFPAVSLWIREAIEQAYRGEGWPSIARRMDAGRKQPVEFYVWKAFELARMTGTAVLVVACALIAIGWRRARIPVRDRASPQRWMVVLAIWMGLHLALFLAVQRYHSWYAYVSAIPFCCWLGVAVSSREPALRPLAWLAAGMMAWLAAFSPLVRGLQTWKSNGEFSTLVMSEVARVAAEVPAGCKLEFLELPNQNSSWHERGPEPLSPFTLNRASTISWVKLLQPDKGLRVDVRSQKPVAGSVTAIRMETEPQADGRIVVRSRVTLAGPDALRDRP